MLVVACLEKNSLFPHSNNQKTIYLLPCNSNQFFLLSSLNGNRIMTRKSQFGPYLKFAKKYGHWKTAFLFWSLSLQTQLILGITGGDQIVWNESWNSSHFWAVPPIPLERQMISDIIFLAEQLSFDIVSIKNSRERTSP